MHPRIDPPASLLRLAARHGWLVSVADADRHGMHRAPVERMVAAGHWQRLTYGLYYVRSDEPPWDTFAWAGVLLGGAGARLADAAAGFLDGILPRAPERIRVFIPAGRYLRPRGRWSFAREPEGLRRGSVGSPPRVCLEDVVLDLGAGLDEAGVIELVTRAIQTRRTSAERIRRRLDERPRVAHRRLFELVLADAAAGAHSALEIFYLRQVERAHGLPTGVRQAAGPGAFRDVLYEEYATIVELDGRAGHGGTERFRDMDRDNRSTISGAATLRFGWHDTAGDPCRVAWMVARVLRDRGWTGVLVACPRCPGGPGRFTAS